MKKISKVKDSWGETVIYVSKCDRYKVENPDIPRLMSTDLQKKIINYNKYRRTIFMWNYSGI